MKKGNFKWPLIAATVLSTLILTGCGQEEPQVSQADLDHKRQLELLETTQKFQLEMKKLELQSKVQTNDAYQSSTTDTQAMAAEQVHNDSSNGEQDYISPGNSNGSNNYTDQGQSSPSEEQSADSGFSGGELLLGTLGGALAGYAVGEMLDNGYRSATDDRGRTVYVDNHGQKVQQSEYTRAKSKYGVKQKVKNFANKAKDKTKAAYTTVKGKAAPLANKAKEKAVSGYQAAKTKAAPVIQKGKEKINSTYQSAKPKVKSATRAIKLQSRKVERKARNKIRSVRKSRSKR